MRLQKRRSGWVSALVGAFAAFAPLAASAQQQQPAQQPQPVQPQSTWDTMPRMQLERQFAGPLRDTVVQRWRDTDGTVCYIYLPISAQHSPPSATGFVTYGSNTIGSISCFPAARTNTQPAAGQPKSKQ
jgi:hypothetical protein